MKFVFLIFVAVIVGFSIIMFMRKSHPEIVVGGLYSARASENAWGIVKILAHHEDNTIHVRLYSNTYQERPDSVDPNALFLRSLNDPEGGQPGIGHLPVTDKVFFSWFPILISVVEVSEEEMEGYRSFKNAGGGAFDMKWFKK